MTEAALHRIDVPSPLDAVAAALGDVEGQSSDFDLTPGLVPAARRLTQAAVLVPLVERPGGLHVILTRRARHLKRHPGQIAFPGGRVDPGDASHWAAALREAEEEIALDPGLVRPLGRLPRHRTVTHYEVEPHVGHVDESCDLRPAEAEVAEVFEVPLAHVADLSRYSLQNRIWQGQARAYYAVPWGPYYIWGATARMLRELALRLA